MPPLARLARIDLLACLALTACGGASPNPQAPLSTEPVEVVIAAPEAPPVVTSIDPEKADEPAAPPGEEASALISAEQRRKIELEIEKLDLVMLGALNNGTATSMNVLSAGSAAGLGPAALHGGQPGTGSLQLGGGGLGGVGGGVVGGGLGGSPPAAAKVKGPVGAASVDFVSGAESSSNTRAVVAGMAAGFRRCYNRSLAQDPSLKGTVVLTVTLGKNGEVLSAFPSGLRGLSSEVTACLAQRVKAAQFAPPDKGTATFKIKVNLQAQ